MAVNENITVIKKHRFKYELTIKENNNKNNKQNIIITASMPVNVLLHRRANIDNTSA